MPLVLPPVWIGRGRLLGSSTDRFPEYGSLLVHQNSMNLHGRAFKGIHGHPNSKAILRIPKVFPGKVHRHFFCSELMSVGYV